MHTARIFVLGMFFISISSFKNMPVQFRYCTPWQAKQRLARESMNLSGFQASAKPCEKGIACGMKSGDGRPESFADGQRDGIDFYQ